MAEAGGGSVRDGVRWGLLLAAVAVTGYRLPRVVRSFQEWRAALPVDPRCDTCMDAKAFTDMVARSEKNFTEKVREAEAKK